MPLILSRQDITTMETDAVVNAAGETLLGGGGVDGAIHRAAGPELRAACARLGGCPPGEARRTGAYRLPAKYVIHTVGPRWQGGSAGEEETLRSCYRNSLRLALEAGCESVAFPLISAGSFGYPRQEALRIAREEILRFLGGEEMTVFLILFGRNPAMEQGRFPELSAVLAEPEEESRMRAVFSSPGLSGSSAAPPPVPERTAPRREKEKRRLFDGKNAAPLARRKAAEPLAAEAEAAAPQSLEEALRVLDESFSQMLLRKITEKGMTDSECYKRANIDRKHFSKIRSDPLYRPSKPTALAFAVALELSLPETRELLMKAGFALSRSSRFDIIVEYYIRRGEYDIFRINETLFAFDQNLLGS